MTRQHWPDCAVSHGHSACDMGPECGSDGISTSGREHLSLEDRASWLASELVTLRLQNKTLDGERLKGNRKEQRTLGDQIHTLGGIIGEIDCLASLTRSLGVHGYAEKYEERYKAPLAHSLSQLECRVLAFKRGGADEVRKWRKAWKDVKG